MSILQKRVEIFLSSTKQTSRMQKGFRKGNGCMEHVQLIKMIMDRAKKNLEPLYGVFVDLKDAFGSLPHEEIFQEMKNNKIPKSIRNIIEEYYKNSYAYIEINESTKSGPIPIGKGVKQG
eukprot:gnl/Chilomastix_caulleri/2140.p1 GENE.gnl/Chilomastix_caulleri/2140~~gnl/Chilomastix_caulleri/2140.p1  ORF type:complete len:120 (-),score=9.24 gnl/Chilomastix_caulleri/2140:29-388(-)